MSCVQVELDRLQGFRMLEGHAAVGDPQNVDDARNADQREGDDTEQRHTTLLSVPTARPLYHAIKKMQS